MTVHLSPSAFSSDATRPLTLGLLTPHNPFDRTAFSGTAFFAARALETHPRIRLRHLLNHRPPRPTDRLRRLWSKPTRPSAPAISAFKGLDAVIGLVASPLLDQLPFQTSLPFFHVTDATPSFLRKTYGWNIPKEADALEARVVRKARAVLYSSDIMARRARTEFGAGINAQTAPFGINFETLPAHVPVKPALDRLELLFVCTDWIRKGGDIAIDILDGIRAGGVDAHMTLVGNLPEHLQCHPGVTCVGVLNKNRKAEAAKLSRLYAQAHLLLLPSRGDCTPMVVGEAMAHGTPVIGSQTGGLPSLVPPGAGKIMRQGASISDWIHATQQLTHDVQTFERISKAAFKHAHCALTWEKWADTVEAQCRKDLISIGDKTHPQLALA